MSTNDNLHDAFAGESQANRKYLFFAEKAEEEGFAQVARLFRAAADAETVHAKNHLKVLDGIRSTFENLSEAIKGESYEFTEMYPQYIKQSEAEGNAKAQHSFEIANKVEQVHHELYKKALDMVEKGQTIENKQIFVCQVCGYTIEGEAPDKCPVCGAPLKMFKLIE